VESPATWFAIKACLLLWYHLIASWAARVYDHLCVLIHLRIDPPESLIVVVSPTVDA
jgi:hypothetical protein